MQQLFTVSIIRKEDKRLIQCHTGQPKRRAEKLKDGIEINLNHEKFQVKITEEA